MKNILIVIAIILGIVISIGTYNINSKKSLLQESVAFTMGNGPEVVYLFTDPLCPICKKLSKNIEESFKDYTIHVVPFLSSDKKIAKFMIYWVLSAENESDRALRMRSLFNGELLWKETKLNEEQYNRASLALSKAKFIGDKLSVKGTPYLLNSNLSPISYKVLEFNQFDKADFFNELIKESSDKITH